MIDAIEDQVGPIVDGANISGCQTDRFGHERLHQLAGSCVEASMGTPASEYS